MPKTTPVDSKFLKKFKIILAGGGFTSIGKTNFINKNNYMNINLGYQNQQYHISISFTNSVAPITASVVTQDECIEFVKSFITVKHQPYKEYYTKEIPINQNYYNLCDDVKNDVHLIISKLEQQILKERKLESDKYRNRSNHE